MHFGGDCKILENSSETIADVGAGFCCPIWQPFSPHIRSLKRMLKPVITTAVLPRGLRMVEIKMLAGNNKRISFKRWSIPHWRFPVKVVCETGHGNVKSSILQGSTCYLCSRFCVINTDYQCRSHVLVLSSFVWGLLVLSGEFGDSSILLGNVVQWLPWMQCMVTCNLIRGSRNGCPMVVIPVGMDGPTLVALDPLSLHCKHLIKFPC